MAEKAVKNSAKQTTLSYTKAQIVESKMFGDFAEAFLCDDREYTLSEVEDLIKNYMEGQVN